MRGRRVSSIQCHANVIRGGNDGGFHAVVGSETRLSGVEELVVVELFGEASVDDFL